MQVASPNNRIEAVDALRGFALAGIVFAHMIEQFIGAPRPESWAVESNIFDHMASGFHFIFVMGKFFSIFAVLFGMSFAIMMGNAAAKGRSFSGRFIWRLAILGAIGFVHSLFYRGDILTVYVAIGFCLPLFYRVSSKTLWFIVVLLCLGAGRYLFYLLTGTASILSYEYTPESPVVAADSLSLTDSSVICVVCPNGAVGLSLLALAFSVRRASVCPAKETIPGGTLRLESPDSKDMCFCTTSGALSPRGISWVVGGDSAPRRPTSDGPPWLLLLCVLDNRPLIASVPSKSSETAS